MTIRQYAGGAPATTVATANVLVGDTTINVVSTTGYPDGSVGPFFLVLDRGLSTEEKVLCTGKTATTFTGVTRGQDGTSAAQHNIGANVNHILTALDASDVNHHVFDTTRDDHTQYILTAGTRAFTGLTAIAATTPTTSAIGDAAALGTSLQLAKADHLHGRESAATVINTAHPSGTVLMYGAAAAPASWVNCDGSAISRTGANANLFAAIGTTYGAGDGSTTFNVPDMRGRIPVGVGTGTGGGASGTGLPTGGSALTARALGGWIGEETHALTTGELPAHSHGVTDPAHSHTMSAHNHGTSNDSHSHGPPAGAQNFVVQVASSTLGLASPGDGVDTYSSPTASAATGITINNTTSTMATATTGVTTNNTGSGTAHNNIQPMMCLNFIIKL